MKQIIPFTKDITFKNQIGELTSISLDNDLQLKGEDLISGNFYIKGKYKLTKASQIEEEYSYKIPCEIAISDDYDTFDATIDIDDFYYDIINDEILKVNIAVVIDNLIKKEIPEVPEQKIVLEAREVRNEEKEKNEVKEKIETSNKENEPKIIFNYEESEVEKRETINPINIISDTKKDVFNELDSSKEFTTYCVYLVSDNDTIDSIADKYHIKKEEIYVYNDIKELQCGMKLLIPDIKNEQ